MRLQAVKIKRTDPLSFWQTTTGIVIRWVAFIPVLIIICCAARLMVALFFEFGFYDRQRVIEIVDSNYKIIMFYGVKETVSVAMGLMVAVFIAPSYKVGYYIAVGCAILFFAIMGILVFTVSKNEGLNATLEKAEIIGAFVGIIFGAAQLHKDIR